MKEEQKRRLAKSEAAFFFAYAVAFASRYQSGRIRALEEGRDTARIRSMEGL